MSIKDFSSIHAHTEFSFLDGICSPSELVKAAKEKGLRSIAVTEHGHAHSHAEFYLSGKKEGVRTLLGVEGYIIHDLQEWHDLKRRFAEEKAAKKQQEVDSEEEIDLEKAAAENKANRRILNRKGHLVMVAQNREGLSNIYQIIHKAHKVGFYKKPRADKKILADHSRGVIASSACMGGVISNKLWRLKDGEADWSEIVREAEEFQEIFGKGKFFLELQYNEHEGQAFINECLVKLHRETKIPLICTQDSHYVKPDDWETQEIVHMLMTHKGAAGITMQNKPESYSFKTRSLYVKSPEEMWQAYLEWGKNVPEEFARQAFENTLVFDSLVEDFEPDTTVRLPSLPFSDTFRELGQRAIVGMKAKNLHERDEYKQRLLYELKMIKEKGISNYFIIMSDLVKEVGKKMLIGPGRGSAGGSLLCYLLGVTNIDPIEHKLMFERFINVDRIEIPDVDLDFEDVDQVKEIMRSMYGEDNVACISTFGTNQIKGIVKDVCRVYDIDHNEANRVNAKIEKEMQAIYDGGEAKSAVIIKLDDVYRLSNTFREFVAKYPQIEKPIQRLYGKVHHAGRHASGVVIGDNLPAETAVFYSKGVLQTSFTDGVVNKNLSAMGLVKFDILGLATLSIIKKCVELIAKKKGVTLEEAMEEIDPKKMDFNDLNVMRTVFWENNMTGVFQMTSRGMRKLAVQMRPDCFNDIAALGALYRPGPLGSKMDQLYIQNKEKAKEGKVEYDHPILEEILKDTYGCFVYQEHILELGRKLGNLSWKDTNRLRKLFLKRTKDAAGKRDSEADELKAKLLEGFTSHGLSQEWGENMWSALEKWASYGFNAAHAKAYGMLTMQTAYLRTYHPIEFFAAVLTCGQAAELQSYVDDIRRQGFKILPVDVNKSGHNHELEGDAIRLSLGSVKGVGAAAVEKIRSAAPYADFLDFIDRSGANKTCVQALIKVGAFDELEPNMGLLLKRFELYTSNPKFKQKRQREEFLRQYYAIKDVEDVPALEKMVYERECLEFNLRNSPFTLNGRDRKLDELEGTLAVDYNSFVESDDEVGVLACLLKEVKERPMKKSGEMMGFLKFSDRTGHEFEAPAFSGVWKHISKFAKKGEVYLVTFNRKLESPTNLVVGKPGWSHRSADAVTFLLRLDEVN